MRTLHLLPRISGVPLLLQLLLPISALQGQQEVPVERPENAGAAPLTVTWGSAPETVLGRREVLHLELSRPLDPSEGRLAVVLGDTDITSLTGSPPVGALRPSGPAGFL